MSVRRILTLTAGATATLAGIAAAAPQPGLVTINAPRAGIVVVDSGEARLGLRRAGGVRITDVAVDGRSIPLRIRRAGARGARIVIPASRLHRGRNSIWIRSRRGRHTDFDTATVIRTARATGLVRVLRPGAATSGGSTRRATWPCRGGPPRSACG